MDRESTVYVIQMNGVWTALPGDLHTYQSNSGTAAHDDAPAVAEKEAFDLVEPGKLHIATNAVFPPYEMIDDAGNYVGIDMDLAVTLAQRLGLEPVVDDMEFDAALAAVQIGQSDIAIAGITARPDRSEVMDCSRSYHRAVQSVLVPAGSPIQSLDDLGSARCIGVIRNTTAAIYCVEDYGENCVVSYDDAAIVAVALQNGQIDAAVLDQTLAQHYATGDLTILSEPYADESYVICLRKGNTQLLDAVDQELAAMESDGTIDAIVRRYMSPF